VEVEVVERNLKGVKLLIHIQPIEDSPFSLVLSANDEKGIEIAVKTREV